MRLIVLFLFVTYTANANAFTKISKFDEIKQPDQLGTLVVLDLDDTVMKPRGEVGSMKWYNALVSNFILNGLSESKAHEYVMNKWNKLQFKLKMKPLDPDTQNWIFQRQMNHTPVIALTARGKEITTPTVRQLRELGIVFSEFTMTTNGILFAGETIPKGIVLAQFLESHLLQYQRIIFVDDTLVNLASVYAHLSGSGIDLELYQFLGSPCSALEASP